MVGHREAVAGPCVKVWIHGLPAVHGPGVSSDGPMLGKHMMFPLRTHAQSPAHSSCAWPPNVRRGRCQCTRQGYGALTWPGGVFWHGCCAHGLASDCVGVPPARRAGICTSTQCMHTFDGLAREARSPSQPSSDVSGMSLFGSGDGVIANEIHPGCKEDAGGQHRRRAPPAATEGARLWAPRRIAWPHFADNSLVTLRHARGTSFAPRRARCWRLSWQSQHALRVPPPRP